MAKDEDVCLYRGLCAERCPTGAWDSRNSSWRRRRRTRIRPLESTNDFVAGAPMRTAWPASANASRQVDPGDGVLISSRNIFLEHPGPADLVRGAGVETGYPAPWRVDLMVAIIQTWDKDIASIEPGGYLFYDPTRPVPPAKLRDDIHVVGVPLTEICNREQRSAPAPAVQEHHVCARCRRADMDVAESSGCRAVQGKAKPIAVTNRALQSAATMC
jgi:2-oxoglutarate ferredoxin oxidoreductase subunit alpha